MTSTQRAAIAAPIAAALAVLAVVGSVWAGGSTATQPAGPAASACQPLLTTPIPTWARAGFTGHSYPPFAYSASRNLVAIVFGNPLTAPPTADHHNKILWVVRDGTVGDLVINARLEGTGRTTTLDTTLGPSIINMPAPGCWHLNLSYGNHTDSINLRWMPG